MQLIANLGLLLLTLQGARADEAGSSCPPIHIIVARGTGIPPGYDLILPLVQTLVLEHPGATSEPLEYPACGGGASCGGISYFDSVRAGTAAVAKTVNDFNARCPQTKLVLMGYSQGGHIIDNALCGGPDENARITSSTPAINPTAANMIKAVTFMGSPRFQAGFPYDQGTCREYGFDARPANFQCPNHYGDRIQSYCDHGDRYCCSEAGQPGWLDWIHGSYVLTYGAAAVAFINKQLA
ncbi:hypothetical protein E4U54_001140 [Claviceps lovelessii]|nr:hypothetical protein E4U54_001140 [Claviceps lovelessii]